MVSKYAVRPAAKLDGILEMRMTILRLAPYIIDANTTHGHEFALRCGSGQARFPAAHNEKNESLAEEPAEAEAINEMGIRSSQRRGGRRGSKLGSARI